MSVRKIARLSIRMRGYVAPDTSSQFEGYVEPGTYLVLDMLSGHPDADTDYVRVYAPSLGASDTWLCARWRGHRYLELAEEQVPVAPIMSFEDDPGAIDEEELVNLLPEFESFTYDLDEARYPWSLPGVKLPQTPPATNNCCTFVEALCVKAFAGKPGFEWDARRHRQMMIASSEDWFSPITAAVESGMAVPVPLPDTPHPWMLVQGWRRQWNGGHTFLVVAHHAPTDKVLTLESNSAYALNGTGFRGIGNLRQFQSRPPDRWWENPNVWTWERLRSTYLFSHHALLRVRPAGFSKLDALPSGNAARAEFIGV